MKPERIQDALNTMPGWQADVPRRQQLVREAQFQSLAAACDFMVRLAEAIGTDEDRVVDVVLRDGCVRLAVADPESGEVTEADLALIRRLQALFEACGDEPNEAAGG